MCARLGERLCVTTWAHLLCKHANLMQDMCIVINIDKYRQYTYDTSQGFTGYKMIQYISLWFFMALYYSSNNLRTSCLIINYERTFFQENTWRFGSLGLSTWWWLGIQTARKYFNQDYDCNKCLLIPVVNIKSEYLKSTGLYRRSCHLKWHVSSRGIEVNDGECMRMWPQKNCPAGNALPPCHDSSPPLSGPWFHQVVGSRPPQQRQDHVPTCWNWYMGPGYPRGWAAGVGFPMKCVVASRWQGWAMSMSRPS